ncbi:hypothetical protein PUN28_000243 [Cardiocondyla obscurior]|uniref:Uncharacterized protein n=1 Tax=Cardiocondyla obscurior TaxID=286306 RepID=A0AAW2GYF0_9HYME
MRQHPRKHSFFSLQYHALPTSFLSGCVPAYNSRRERRKHRRINLFHPTLYILPEFENYYRKAKTMKVKMDLELISTSRFCSLKSNNFYI